MATPPLQPLDPARIRALRDLAGHDMPDLPGDVAVIFLETAAKDVSDLLDAARTEDHESVAALAHRLRGSSANIGASTLHRLCGALERGDARSEDLVRLTVELERVDASSTSTTENERPLRLRPESGEPRS